MTTRNGNVARMPRPTRSANNGTNPPRDNRHPRDGGPHEPSERGQQHQPLVEIGATTPSQAGTGQSGEDGDIRHPNEHEAECIRIRPTGVPSIPRSPHCRHQPRDDHERNESRSDSAKPPVSRYPSRHDQADLRHEQQNPRTEGAA